MGDETNGWVEYKRVVLKELETLNTKVDRLETELNKLDKDVCREIALLKQKSALWGTIAAMIVTAIIQIGIRFIH